MGRDRQAVAGWQRIWLRGEELGGIDIVSFNLYRLAGPGSILKPCEMSSIEFVLGFEPGREEATSRHGIDIALQHAHGCTAI